MKSNRKIFYEWKWCLHCERVFRSRRNDKCKYKGCDGGMGDIWSWESLRGVHLDYPIVPEENKVYPLY